MQLLKRLLFVCGLLFAWQAQATEVSEDQAARQMSVLLKSYYPPTIKTLEKLGTIVPYVAYIKVDGTLGHYDLDGVEPTFDFLKVGNYISMLYSEIAKKRDEYLTFAIFAVTPMSLEGETKTALTAMIEHKSGFGYQKVWILSDDGLSTKIERPIQIKYDPVVFTE